MQIKFIESFLVLYEEKNMSNACKRLFITQQGLSRQIQALEKELDLPLFTRTNTGVIPTEISNLIYPKYLSIYKMYMQTQIDIKTYKEQQDNRIAIAFATGLSNATDTSFLAPFQFQHPEIELDILEFPKEVCIQKLKSKELDIIFIVNPFDSSAFQLTPLAEGAMYLAVHKSHRFASYDDPIPFSELKNEKIITGSPQNVLRELFDYYCALESIEPRIIISSSYSFSIINSMKENMGIGTVTARMAALLTNQDIVIKQLETPEPGIMYAVTLLADRQPKSLKLLHEFLRDTFPYAKSIKYTG